MVPYSKRCRNCSKNNLLLIDKNIKVTGMQYKIGL